MPQPVIHHVEICARDMKATLKRLKKFGFKCFAKKETPICKQIVIKLGGVFFLISERKNVKIKDRRNDPLAILCCEEKVKHEVDTVFNVVFTVQNVKNMTQRVQNAGGTIIEPPTSLIDGDGEIEFSIIKSICGNVVHTLLNKDKYNGHFLVGFEPMDDDSPLESMEIDSNITHIDHITLAVQPYQSQRVLQFYEAWGMIRFSISKDDTEEDGLILADGVGLRLRAMEYWRCAETGLSFVYAPDKERNPNSVMLVVVESLLGQINCNIERFLSEHRGPGIEHVALNAPDMTHTVQTLLTAGVKFRKPPLAYYDELQKTKQIADLGEDLSTLKKLGILLDNENSSENEADKRYLMQIFAEPLFDAKTFFIELIKRVNNARGLGSGNVIALVKSIREEERRKAAETKIKEEAASNPRQLY